MLRGDFEMEALPLRKETIFEGYVVPHYEALLLEREPPFYLDTKFLGYRHMKGCFEDYIKNLLERRKDKEPQIISLEDIIPLRSTEGFCKTLKQNSASELLLRHRK
jgi:hypothetical protein